MTPEEVAGLKNNTRRGKKRPNEFTMEKPFKFLEIKLTLLHLQKVRFIGLG
jgi:hypothetical protein